MLNNKISERERLLKLIDGGPEAIKEIEKKQIENLDRARAAAVFSFIKEKTAAIFGKTKDEAASTSQPKNILIPGLLAAAVILAAAYSAGNYMKHKVPPSSAGVITHPTDKSVPDLQAVHLKLVGVDWSNEPVALIEDSRTGKTYFAKKNDSVSDAKVKQIFKDKVIVQVRHQTVELKA